MEALHHPDTNVLVVLLSLVVVLPANGVKDLKGSSCVTVVDYSGVRNMHVLCVAKCTVGMKPPAMRTLGFGVTIATAG